MSNRRRTADQRRLAATLRWWKETGDRLGCAECSAGPACDECGHALAVTVATFGTVLDIATLERSHFHVCDQCREAIHLGFGLERHELGEG